MAFEIVGESSHEKEYDYLLKFLLVGDSDVGKQEIISGLEDGSTESPYWNGYGELQS
jgi:Ras-related protein Rab-40